MDLNLFSLGSLLTSALSFCKVKPTKKHKRWYILGVGLLIVSVIIVAVMNGQKPSPGSNSSINQQASGNSGQIVQVGNVSTLNHASSNSGPVYQGHVVNVGFTEGMVRKLLLDKSVSWQRELSFKYLQGWLLLGALPDGRVLAESGSKSIRLIEYQISVAPDLEELGSVAVTFHSLKLTVVGLLHPVNLQNVRVIFPYANEENRPSMLPLAAGRVPDGNGGERPIIMYLELIDRLNGISVLGFSLDPITSSK